MTKTLHRYTLTIEDIPIQVCHKKVKNLNLRIYPPNGEVRLSAPLSLSPERVRLFLSQKIGWIRKKRADALLHTAAPEAAQTLPNEIEILGTRLVVRQGEQRRNTHFREAEGGVIEITLAKGDSPTNMKRVLDHFALEILKQKIPLLIARWEKTLGVQVSEWRIRRMKTRWGSCNPKARRIWLNAELAKKPFECLEYVVVHEMLHLLERRHNNTFYALMDRFLPDWKQRKTLLRNR